MNQLHVRRTSRDILAADEYFKRRTGTKFDGHG